MYWLVDKQLFGSVIAYVYVFEWQKRGLPHVHVLITLAPGSKLKDTDDIDTFILAELPDKDVDPQLKNYPKQYNEKTTVDSNGYPKYRRSNNVFINGQDYTNIDVVPYSPQLSRIFDCHINVELCNRVEAIKYLYKYVYKDSDLFDALNKAATLYTTLTAWFAINYSMAESERLGADMTGRIDSHKLNYIDMPDHYTFDTRAGWKKRERKGHKIVARMYTVSPGDPERYALRLLLLHKKGALSFEDFRTVDDANQLPLVFDTFVDAAKAYGLLSDDTEHIKTLEECALVQMPYQLRSVFVALLAFTDVADPPLLFDGFKDAMSEDYVHSGLSVVEAYSALYLDLSERLWRLGKELGTFIAPPVDFDPNVNVEDVDRSTEISRRMVPTLNTNQKAIFDTIVNALQTPSSQRVFFLDGPGGSGKTYLYTALFHTLSSRNVKVQCTAWTSLASTLLPQGRTSASLFKLNIHNDCKTSGHKINTKDGTSLRNIDVFIWDECSIVSKNAIETVDLILRDLTGVDSPFGGKLMVFGGDFRQVLPVVRRGTRSDQVQSCIKASKLWSIFVKLSLVGNMRVQNDDEEWKQFLLTIGNGDANGADRRVDLPCSIQHVPDIVASVFGDRITTSDDRHRLSQSAILTPLNVDVLLLNTRVQSLLDGEERIFASFDEVVDDSCSNYITTELLNSMNTSSLPPHKLALKVGSIVVLLRNLDVMNGLCNGTRLVVDSMRARVIRCRIIGIEGLGRHVLIPRIDCYDDQNMSFRMKGTQFPVKWAYAMSINKSQGQSFHRIGIYSENDVFTHGQLYVALSRVRSVDGLCFSSCNPRPLNVVFPEIL